MATKKKAPGATLKVKVGSTTRTYKRTRCGTKSAISAAAKKIRDAGGTARVVKNGTKHCLYKGPRRKKAGRRK